MRPAPLPRLLYEAGVRAALIEDLGRAGDITSAAVIPEDHVSRMDLAARADGVLAGLDVAALAFELMDPRLTVERLLADGDRLAPGSVIARVSGPSRAILAAERTALNYLGHLSGIATVTAGIVDAIRDYRATVVCTRKTTPGLRLLEKQAVRAGGGGNHRFGLDDAVLIKDNHVAIAGGTGEAVRRAKAAAGHMVKIEVEVDRLDQIEPALAEGVDAILLDNMTPAELADAVALVAGRALTEASGRVTPATAPAIARSGVDLISVGWLTHSAPVLDIGLDVA